MTFSEQIGMAIRVQRKRQKISQKDFCARAGMGAQNLWYIERGKTQMPIDTLERVCKALGHPDGATGIFSLACEINMAGHPVGVYGH